MAQLASRTFDQLEQCVISFYHAMICIRSTSHGPVSVRLSVTSWCSFETAERIELVLACELPSTHPTLC